MGRLLSKSSASRRIVMGKNVLWRNVSIRATGRGHSHKPTTSLVPIAIRSARALAA